MERQSLDLKHQTLRGETLSIDGKAELRSSIWMCELIDCTIESTASSRAFGFVDSTMRGGVFWQRVVLSEKKFDRVRFEGVKLKGRFKGVDFGGLKDNFNHPVDAGALEGCDLTDAKLHLCRHFNGAFISNRYSDWPTVVVKAGGVFVMPEISTVDERAWRRLIGVFDQHPAGECVVIVDAAVLAKESKTPVEELRTFFELNRASVISGL